ncbi:MAG: hypothetical protein RIG84_04760 [Roseovarius sp.]
MIDAIQATQHARALLDARGAKALAEASQKMKDCEEAGQTEEAENWRKIRMALSEMRGPHQG